MAAPAPVAGTSHWDKYARGTPEDLSPEQSSCVDEFLRRCPQDHVESVRFPREPPRHLACRMLRASKYSVEDALRRTSDTAAWRKENRCDELRERNPVEVLGCAEDELLHFYPKAYFPEADREGRPVYVEKGGIADADALFVITNDDKLVDYHIYANEREMRDLFTRMSDEAGRPVASLLAIIDMAGMNMKLANATTARYIKRMVGIDSAHYPETLGKMLIINVPKWFSAAYALITPFLDERTQRKIEIISAPAAWQARLRELVDPAKLPVEYGGTQVVPGGLWHPSRTVCTHLAAGAVHREVIPMAPGQSIQLKWFVRPGDIRFSVHAGQGSPPPGLDPAAGAEGGAAGGAAGGSSTRSGSSGSFTTPAGLTEVYKDRAHPDSEKSCVVVRHTWPASAPTGGYLLAVYSNKEGWRGRDLYHRWDTLEGEGGLPKQMRM